MDLTPMFKASIMAVKMRNKKLPTQNKNRILQNKIKDEYARQAKDVCYKITALRNILLENRAAYMKFAAHLKSSVQMTDEERDLIDRESEKIINYYTQNLTQLKSEWRMVKKTKSQQHADHIETVLELLNNYLRAVHNIHIEQKKYRMQYELETYRFLKLASDKKKIPICPGKDIIKNNSLANHDDFLHDDINENFNQYNDDDDIDILNMKNQSNLKDDRSISMQQKVALEDSLKDSYEETLNELTPEDIQMYESENVQLYHELQGLSEEVEQIEKNVVDIARLQEIFTEKVVLQKHDIERIANAVVGATENVKDANDQIKQAIQRNAGLRVWTLFFLLVMSFTLLFLDWYND